MEAWLLIFEHSCVTSNIQPCAFISTFPQAQAPCQQITTLNPFQLFFFHQTLTHNKPNPIHPLEKEIRKRKTNDGLIFGGKQTLTTRIYIPSHPSSMEDDRGEVRRRVKKRKRKGKGMNKEESTRDVIVQCPQTD
ncbi:hypothetical protein VTJ04DRAFT_581 [Mycothermus thermophilus]|uniref:uncharacterized protein n=1 Tax=Humicola insolens TaxID=85995 RepID=UPI003742B9C8